MVDWNMMDDDISFLSKIVICLCLKSRFYFQVHCQSVQGLFSFTIQKKISFGNCEKISKDVELEL